MAEAYLVAENISIPIHFPGTEIRLKGRKIFHDKIPCESNAYNYRETEAEEYFRRNVILITLDFILSDVENFLEVHKSICDLFYLKLPSIIQQGTLRKVRKPL
jgi:hypothetical protein